MTEQRKQEKAGQTNRCSETTGPTKTGWNKEGVWLAQARPKAGLPGGRLEALGSRARGSGGGLLGGFWGGPAQGRCRTTAGDPLNSSPGWTPGRHAPRFRGSPCVGVPRRPRVLAGLLDERH